MSYNSTFASPMGRTSRGAYVAALIVLLAVAAFYYVLVKGLNGEWVLFTLLYPAFVLMARRLHDMGLTAALALVPVALVGEAIWPGSGGRGAFGPAVTLASLALAAAFALWGCVGKAKP